MNEELWISPSEAREKARRTASDLMRALDTKVLRGKPVHVLGSNPSAWQLGRGVLAVQNALVR